MRSLSLLALLALAACSTIHTERNDTMVTTHAQSSDTSPASPHPRITIELLALDLATCGRCTGTEASLDDAIDAVADLLREAEVDVEVRKIVVKTAAQAQTLRFESSPTIRINGRDIALELRESNCGDCGDLCGCDGQVDCRVWVWRGRTYDQAPKALIIDAILRSYAQAWQPPPAPRKTFVLPENLQRFFEQRAAAPAGSSCCGKE